MNPKLLAVVRWIGLIFVGALLWMLGLMALDVPADLEKWRHVVGVVLIVCAVQLLNRACCFNFQKE